MYSLSKRQWSLVVQEEQFSKYSCVGLLDGLDGWVSVADSKGQARVFHLDNYHEVWPSITLLNNRISNGMHVKDLS